MTDSMPLTEVVRAVGGWPVDLDAVARVLEAADALLPEGRDTSRPLTPAEVAALALVASGLASDPVAALVDLARQNDADFRPTAVRNMQRAGVPRSAATKLTGHKIESVYRRYAIVNDADLREATLRLTGTFPGTIARGRVDSRPASSDNA